MFERFTDRARRVVVLAQEEARLLGYDYIGPEHILLGLISEGDSVAARVLVGLGISVETARSEVESMRNEVESMSDRRSPSGHIPFTSGAKKVLELSLREALQLGHDYIGPEHILLGLIREAESEGAEVRVLANLGVEPSRVRNVVLQVLASLPGGLGQGQPASPASGKTPAARRLGVNARRLAGSGAVGSHHYLLALVGQEDSMAAKALAALGVTPEAVEQQLGDLDPAGTSDETPEQAGARRISLRLEGQRLTVEIDDPDLAASLERAMAGRKAGIIRGTDPEAEAFPALWSAVSFTVDDLTRRMGRG
ncbi:MAG TPA: Clp protease N-terminal domain-containing protein [Acidimicrobiales bacterium]|nr:Clp protease N-terminal domain-containing protein [Acidimicrobiales bacterium]